MSLTKAWTAENPLWVRLGVGGLASWALQEVILDGAKIETFVADFRRACGDPAKADLELRVAASELLRATRERSAVELPEWDDHQASIRGKVDQLMAAVGARPFDWATPRPCFMARYRTKDEEEWEHLGGRLTRPDQDQSQSFICDLRVKDCETGLADVLLDSSRLGLIRDEEPALRALPEVRLVDVPYDPSRFPTPGEQRAHGRWST